MKKKSNIDSGKYAAWLTFEDSREYPRRVAIDNMALATRGILTRGSCEAYYSQFLRGKNLPKEARQCINNR